MRSVKVWTLVASVMLLGACGKGIVSPNGNLRAEVDGQTVSVYYVDEGISGDGKLLAASVHVGLVTEDDDLDSGLILKKAAWKWKVNEDYMMVAGKRKHCHNEAYERIYTYSNPDGKVLDVILRLYNDGVAIRYKLPDGTVVTEDRTAYTVRDWTNRWISPLKTDYESFFPLATDGGPTKERMWPRPEPGRWAYPALVQPAENVFTLISEADLRHGDSASSLDNSADNEVYQVHMTGPAAFHGGESPWRVVIIGSLSDIVESTLITDLSSYAEFDPDWVEPGVSSWVYWAYNHGSKDFQLDKEFIDLAAEQGWPYCLIDWEWPEMENGGDITDLLAYAREKGVKINLWYNSGTSWVGEGAPQPQVSFIFHRLHQPGIFILMPVEIEGCRMNDSYATPEIPLRRILVPPPEEGLRQILRTRRTEEIQQPVPIRQRFQHLAAYQTPPGHQQIPQFPAHKDELPKDRFPAPSRSSFSSGPFDSPLLILAM